MTEKLTRKEAFELSVRKWEIIVSNNGAFPPEFPKEISTLRNNCGLCEKYVFSKNEDLCLKCPIRLPDENYNVYSVGCLQENHPFNKYRNSKTKENAQKVLDLIKSMR